MRGSTASIVRRELTGSGSDPVEPCAMRIGPSHWSAVHGQKEAAPRSLPIDAPSDVRKHLRRFVRDPIIAERADRSRELLPFRSWGDIGQYSRVEDDERSVLRRLSGERCDVGAQITFDQPGPLLGDNHYRRAQPPQPIRLLRPHECFQPGHLRGVREVDGVEIEPRPPVYSARLPVGISCEAACCRTRTPCGPWRGSCGSRGAALDAASLYLRDQCRDAGPNKTAPHRRAAARNRFGCRFSRGNVSRNPITSGSEAAPRKISQ